MAVSPENQSYSIQNLNGRVEFTTQGGYVLQWKVCHPITCVLVPVFFQGSELKRTGIPPLVPGYDTDIEGVRRHGFGRDVLWTPTIESPDHARLTLNTDTVKFTNNEKYPKGVEFEIDLQLTPEGSLEYKFRAANKSLEDAQVGMSLHPYFAIEHNEKSQIRFFGVPGLEKNDIPWDESSPDQSYTYNRIMGINYPDGKKLTIKDLTRPDSGFDRAQLWSRNPKEDSLNNDFVCLEPLGKVRTLKPGQDLETRLRFQMEFP